MLSDTYLGMIFCISNELLVGGIFRVGICDTKVHRTRQSGWCVVIKDFLQPATVLVLYRQICRPGPTDGF